MSQELNFDELESTYSGAQSGDVTSAGGGGARVGAFKGKVALLEVQTGKSGGDKDVAQLQFKAVPLEGEFAGTEFELRTNLEAGGSGGAKAVMANLKSLVAIAGWIDAKVDFTKMKRKAQSALYTTFDDRIEDMKEGGDAPVIIVDRVQRKTPTGNFWNHAFEKADVSSIEIASLSSLEPAPQDTAPQSQADSEAAMDDDSDFA